MMKNGVICLGALVAATQAVSVEQNGQQKAELALAQLTEQNAPSYMLEALAEAGLTFDEMNDYALEQGVNLAEVEWGWFKRAMRKAKKRAEKLRKAIEKAARDAARKV